jgi:hypothetical protein
MGWFAVGNIEEHKIPPFMTSSQGWNTEIKMINREKYLGGGFL